MQTHPLYAQDRAIVDRLLAASPPDPRDLVDAARLRLRYRGFPGALDLQRDLQRCLDRWQLDPDQLQARTRALWASGWRPAELPSDAPIGSGADVNA